MPLNARFTQVDRESVVAGTPEARITQVDRETVVAGSPDARFTQIDRESVVRGSPRARFTQVVREAVVSFAAGPAITTACPTTEPVWNEAYSYGFEASGGSAPYTWSIVSGALPPGLGLNSATGVISGAAHVLGSFTYTVEVTDAERRVGTLTCTFVIANPCPPCTFTQEAERACDFTKAAERACEFTKEGEC